MSLGMRLGMYPGMRPGVSLGMRLGNILYSYLGGSTIGGFTATLLVPEKRVQFRYICLIPNYPFRVIVSLFPHSQASIINKCVQYRISNL